MHREAGRYVNVRGQPRARQRGDAGRLGLGVTDVIYEDGSRTENHCPAPIGLQQRQTPADPPARARRSLEQRGLSCNRIWHAQS
jgi:hypothetical protein